MTSANGAPLRVLRIYHSGVVGAWRQREREQRALGGHVELLSATSWNEGGHQVALTADGDDFVAGARTFGRHPYLFVYDPVKLWRWLRSKRVDVLDVHEEPASLAAAEVQLLAKLAGVHAPFCLYSAQNLEKRYPLPFRWIEHLALRRARGVHTCNDAAVGIVRRKGFRGVACNLGLGIDLDRFSPEHRPRGEEPLRVGYVGRIESRKGVHVLVDAIARTRDCRLELVGDGPERAAVEHQIRAAGLSERVATTGYCPQDDLPDRYRAFDVVVVPSLDTPSWIEQFGRVAVEAMASGLPVVVSDSGALPEVVGDAGVVVTPGDVEALACVLQRLADDPRERQRLGASARARVERFSWSAIAGRQLRFYQEVVASAA